MKFTKLIFFVVLTLNIIVSAARESNERVIKAHKLNAVEKLRHKLKNANDFDEIPREKLTDVLRLNPAIRNQLEDPEFSSPKTAIKMALRSEKVKRFASKVKRSFAGNDVNDIQYITGTEYHDRECRDHGPRLVKYVGCTMAEFGTWESVKFSGPKNNNVTFYRFDRPGCNEHAIPVKSFINGNCTFDFQTKKYAIWTW